MKVLFVQKHPCIRNYKIAVALKKKGVQVDLAYTHLPISKMYPGLSDSVYSKNIHASSVYEIRKLASSYDVVHSHNEPDDFTIGLLGIDPPLIHDTHDMISLRPIPNVDKQKMLAEKEELANRAAKGRVYVSEYMLKVALERYEVEPERCLVYGNYANKEDIPENLWECPKDGIHIVYQGGVNLPGGHRWYGDIFGALNKAGIHVHVYPSPVYGMSKSRLGSESYFTKSPYLHLHASVSPEKLIKEMVQYDAGIIPFNITNENRLFLNQSMPNKLWEYLGAGLPVIAPRLYSLEKFINETGAGVIYDAPRDIINQIGRLATIKASGVRRHIKTHDDEIGNLISFYRLLGGAK